MPLSLFLPLALAALIVEALIGYPAPLYRAIGHPVTWMGRWLAWLEAALNRADAASATRRAAGGLPAQRTLPAPASAGAEGLDVSLEEGRRAVAKIVGRNPDVLDEAGVAR